MRTAMQSRKLKITTYNSCFRQCTSKIKPWWVVRPPDPEAVFPKENESGEVFGLVSYARGLAHAAPLEPHVAYALH